MYILLSDSQLKGYRHLNLGIPPGVPGEGPTASAGTDSWGWEGYNSIFQLDATEWLDSRPARSVITLLEIDGSMFANAQGASPKGVVAYAKPVRMYRVPFPCRHSGSDELSRSAIAYFHVAGFSKLSTYISALRRIGNPLLRSFPFAASRFLPTGPAARYSRKDT